jgi:hypothetical protein
VGSVEEKTVALFHGFAHQLEFALLEIADAAMDQPRGCRTRSAGEIRHLHQRRGHALCRQVAQNADAVDATANDQDIA